MVQPSEPVSQTPREIYNWKVYLAAISASFGGALFGFDNAFLGGTLALPAFRAQFALEGLPQHKINDLSSNIVITFQAGCLLACFLVTPAAEILGRRMALLIACVIFAIGAGLQLIGSLPSFYIGRFLTGFGVGPMTVVCPMYIAEVAPAKLRGRCVGFFEVMYQFGGLLGFWINYGVSLHLSRNSHVQWRVPVSIQLPFVGALFAGVSLLPETPRWLIKKDRVEEAERTLAQIRNLNLEHDYLRQELADIHHELRIEEEETGIEGNSPMMKRVPRLLQECMKPGMLHRMSVGIIIQLIGQLSGINGINYYSPTIFRSLGVVGTSTGLFATGIYGVVKTVTAIVAYYFIVDQFGRRTLLLVGSVIMTIALFTVGGYIQVAKPSHTDQHITSGGIAACAFIYIYVIGFVSSYAGVPWILSTSQWLFNLVITKATPYMITSIGAGTFFFFGSCVVIGAVYVWFCVPETRGVALERMSEVFDRRIDKESLECAPSITVAKIAKSEEVNGPADVKEIESVRL